jgi:hypothetical protein
VWSSGVAVANQCPVSTSGGIASAWLELFAMWESGIVTISAEWWAKDLDAMTVLSNEARRMEERERP